MPDMFKLFCIASLPPSASGLWYDELRSLEASGFIGRTRGTCMRLYPSLSKGVHHEFVISLGVAYTDEQILDYISDVIHILADLSFVSHFISQAVGRLNPLDACLAYSKIQDFQNT
jgi:hypothetical protein